MQYFGGKQRVSKRLSEFLNGQLKDGQPFVDLFCGSCNIVSNINQDRVRIANDKHHYLIEMWLSLQNGWSFPIKITKEDYKLIKNNPDECKALTGFTGFGMSFGGKWWGGFTGEVSKNGQDYLKCAVNSTTLKLNKMRNVFFCNESYEDVELPEGSLVYCDIPYKGTTPYCKKEVGLFDHQSFYEWCQLKTNEGHKVFVSEYADNVPINAEVVWSVESGTTNAAWMGSAKKTVEVLYTWTKLEGDNND